MTKPPKPVTVTLTAEDAADLQARVERGEFASLDEGVAAELAELNYRRAAEIVGGPDKLEALLIAARRHAGLAAKESQGVDRLVVRQAGRRVFAHPLQHDRLFPLEERVGVEQLLGRRRAQSQLLQTVRVEGEVVPLAERLVLVHGPQDPAELDPRTFEPLRRLEGLVAERPRWDLG